MSTKRKTTVQSASDGKLHVDDDMIQQRSKAQRTKQSQLDSDDDVLVSLVGGGAVTRQGTNYGDGFQPFSKVGRRLTREEEVEWLSQLNRRLEILTLARRAQERGIMTQVQDAKTDEKSLKFELETMAKAYSTVLSQQQQQIQDLSNNTTANDQVLGDLKKEIAALEQQLRRANEAKRANGGELQTYRLKYETTLTQLENAENSISNLQDALDQALDDNQAMADEISGDWDERSDDDGDDDDADDDDGKKNAKKNKKSSSKSLHARRKADQAQRSALEAKVKLLETQLDVERQHFKDENGRNKDALKKANQDKNDLLDQLTAEFQTRLDDALQDQEDEHQEALEELARGLGNQSDGQQRRLADQLAQQRDLVTQLQNTKTLLDEQVAQLRNDLIESETICESWVKQSEQLREEYENEVYQHSTDLNTYQDHIEDLLDAYRVKELEFEELMNVKVSLAMEIQQYRQIIEKEEGRLAAATAANTANASTPTRRSSRRKTTMGDDEDDDEQPSASTTSKAKKDKKTTTGDNTAKLVKTGIDHNGAFVKFTNGSTQAISYDGYSIGSDMGATTEHFTFKGKQFTLAPSQQLIIFFQAPTKQQISDAESSGNVLHDLSDEGIFDETDGGDNKGQLYDKLGRSILQFKFVSKGRKTTAPAAAAAAGTTKKKAVGVSSSAAKKSGVKKSAGRK